ncbi:SDR family oxidoreductase [Bailinhaonella thermotolerans]|uniref:SDR family oxidoreductase n=1 Tax=Bailinhaonella thermotolerans TaxID=1070861 RepID=A0A3A4ACV1_9ACTN|nr:SDR family oxidoreductase [Bailinhaonella thermotolerans]RJL24424.1 SDR family oxidoreductase [Bailinhaonella thermotolerans]
MDLGLRGRTVIVTGASGGVGLATAAMSLAEGASVAACARDGVRLARALEPLPRADGARLFHASCDVTDAEAVRRFAEAAAGELGGIDGLVNNAGRSLMAGAGETTPEQWRDEFELKIFGVLNPLRAALPYLTRSPVGAIVNVNAILARQPEPRLAATSAARAALLNLTKTLSAELAPVRVNSVCLGLIDTGQWRRRFEASGEPSYEAWTGALAADRGIALGRLGRAEEAAYAIVMLLSPLASYITGASLDVGGGVSRYA